MLVQITDRREVRQDQKFKTCVKTCAPEPPLHENGGIVENSRD